MTKQHPISKQVALYQWENLKKSLKDSDVKIDYISPQKKLPDMVFTANGALTYKNKVVIGKFAATQEYKSNPRMDESRYHRHWFTKNKEYEIYNPQCSFEGAGDALFSHDSKHLWVGHGFRSKPEIKHELEDFLGDDVMVHTLKLVDPRFYHLDTCFCPIDDTHLIIYEPAFTPEALYKIYSVFDKHDVITISEEDAVQFTGNSICVPSLDPEMDFKLIGNHFSEEVEYEIANIGGHVDQIDMTEFLRGGGSTKCCVMAL
jgi:N-dimethylarginine dimethylaminohydrolase